MGPAVRHLIGLALLAPLACAMFEDQAGKYDWRRTFIGAPTAAALHSRKPRLSVCTRPGVLATLNLRDGEVWWRHLLDDEGGVDGMAVIEKIGVVVTLSGGGRRLRAWDQLEGALRWEEAVGRGDGGGPSAMVDLVRNDGSADQPVVAVMAGREVKLFAATDGEEIWSAVVSDAPALDAGELGAGDGEIVAATAHTGSGRLRVVSLSVESGAILSEHSETLQQGLATELVIGRMSVGVLSSDYKHVCTTMIKGQQSATCTSVEELLPGKPRRGSLYQAGNRFLVALRGTENNIAALLPASGSSISSTQKYEGVTAATAVLTVDEKSLLGIVGSADDGQGIFFKMVDVTTGEVVHEEFADLHLHGTVGPTKHVESAFLGRYNRKDGTTGFRALLVGGDDSLSLIQQGQVVWSKDEALGSVQSSLFIDPPNAVPGVANLPKGDLLKKIKAQILSLKVQFSLNTEQEKLELMDMKQALSGKNAPLRDPNGSRKYIISATASGKLYALHNGDGRVVWSRCLSQAPFPNHVLLSRHSHDPNEAPQLLLVRLGGPGPSTILTVNAHTGAVSEETVPFGIQKIVQLPGVIRDGPAEQHMFLFVDDSSGYPEAYLSPNLPETRAWLKEVYKQIHFWRSDKGNGTMAGYGVVNGDVDATTGHVQLSDLWSLSFHSPILEIATRDTFDPVHSFVKILGDRTLKFKYLNPNTAFVASGPAFGVPSEELDRESIELTVTVLDTVTGRVLFRQVHRGARGPVKAVFSQHWIVYHYWSLKNQRYQMSAMELYDSGHQGISVLDVMLSEGPNETLSSHQPVPLEVLRSSYFVSNAVKTLTTTKTSKGITTQRVLIGTAADQVYAMDKRFLDPRRPKGRKPTEAREERLIPYSENLYMYPTMYATQNKDVLGLKVSGWCFVCRLKCECLWFMLASIAAT
ncbi:unnamed protein product [Ostreobium quekettii]|uniref:ER membrane protein complex subunit 1 n=1 Tax=Ostreobium quekettii TaxID=121088 RepID=A0A8S1IZ47_9CHLO|nr:unnamed protein product [Ostreobium quekettii]